MTEDNHLLVKFDLGGMPVSPKLRSPLRLRSHPVSPKFRPLMSDIGVSKSQIDEIVLVGGSTRIPQAQQLLKDSFNGKEPSRGINPDEVVVDDGVVLLDVTPLSLRMETVGGILTQIIPREEIIPAKKSQIFSTLKRDEAVFDDGVVLLDVTPLSLRMETVGDILTRIIPREDHSRGEVPDFLNTSREAASRHGVRVFEDERAMTKDNHLLGKFDLGGMPPAPSGQPQIEVAFEIDTKGISKVMAQEAPDHE